MNSQLEGGRPRAGAAWEFRPRHPLQPRAGPHRAGHGDGEVGLTELPDDELLDLVRLDVTRAAP